MPRRPLNTQVAGLLCHFLLWNRSFSGILASGICCEAIIACSLTKPITWGTNGTLASDPDKTTSSNPCKRVHNAAGSWVCHSYSTSQEAVILALNWHVGLSFDAIAVNVHGNSRTARRIMERAKV